MRAKRAAVPVLLAYAAAAAVARGAPSASEVKQRWEGRLDGTHFSARMRMVVERAGQREERVIQVWRDDLSAHRERLMARFDAPPDLRGMGLLYLENGSGPNDYFVYQPATGRIRRVPEVVAREDVYGIDLEYLGFGVAQIEPTRVESVEPASLDDRPALRLTESALRRDARFQLRIVWLDPETFVPLRTEHLRGDQRILVARTEEVRSIDGIPTPMRVVFERPLDHQTIDMVVDGISYRAPIPDAVFSIMNLLKR